MLLSLSTAMALVIFEEPEPALVGLAQCTPGVHLSVSGGKPGIGLSLDIQAGAVWGVRDYNVEPGLVAGPFGEVNAVLGQGISATAGARVSAGGFAPTAFLGFVPYGSLSVDYARSWGAVTGTRKGVHVRSLYFGLGYWRGQEVSGFTAGLEVPLLPPPVIQD
jgi:hypothetical protein